MENICIDTNSVSQRERELRERFIGLLQNSPIPSTELLGNLALYLNRQTLSHLLFMHDLYLKILPAHGVIMEFGVRWGRNLALFESFRGIYEPYNLKRHILGFDTFAGFPSVDLQDGHAAPITAGSYAVSPQYEQYLQSVLDYHEQESPIAHLKKYTLLAGDVAETLPKYLAEHPETVIALAYFDLDLYRPTKAALSAIKPHLHAGSVLGFDELGDSVYPGETIALREELGLLQYKILRDVRTPDQSYIIIGASS